MQSPAVACVGLKLKKAFTSKFALTSSICLVAVLGLFASRAYGGLIKRIEQTRSSAYNYASKQEKFYQFGEFAQKNGANTKDIFILAASENDFWFRYYILFLTGAEARTLTEIMPVEIDIDALKAKYNYVHFVLNKSRYIPDVLAPFTSTNFPNFTVVTIDLTSPDFGKLKEDLTKQVFQELANGCNIFDLYEVKNTYPFIKVINPPLYRLLCEKYETLLSAYNAQYMLDEKVSFIDFYYRNVVPKRYKFYFLFKVNKSIETNWLIYLCGYVIDQHLPLLSEEGQKYKFENWWIDPEPPALSWPPGQYIIIAKELDAEPISYDMKMYFYKPDQKTPTRQIELGLVDLAVPNQPPQPDRPIYEFTFPK